MQDLKLVCPDCGNQSIRMDELVNSTRKFLKQNKSKETKSAKQKIYLRPTDRLSNQKVISSCLLIEDAIMNERSVMFEAQEIYKKIQMEDYGDIDRMKNPFVLIQVSKLIHGESGD